MPLKTNQSVILACWTMINRDVEGWPELGSRWTPLEHVSRLGLFREKKETNRRKRKRREKNILSSVQELKKASQKNQKMNRDEVGISAVNFCKDSREHRWYSNASWTGLNETFPARQKSISIYHRKGTAVMIILQRNPFPSNWSQPRHIRALESVLDTSVNDQLRSMDSFTIGKDIRPMTSRFFE